VTETGLDKAIGVNLHTIVQELITVTVRKDDAPVAVTFRKGITPWLPLRGPASTVAALVH